MHRRSAMSLLLTTMVPALAQRMSMPVGAFLKDVDSVAGLSKIGAALYDADPDKKTWGKYCGDSRSLAGRGEFRLAVRAAAKALHVGDPRGSATGGAFIFASGDIATAYSYAGDHETAESWAQRTLAAIASGPSEDWLQMELPLIKASAYRIRAIALSHWGKHAEALTELRKGQDSMPRFGQGFAKSELRLALAGIQFKAGHLDRAEEALAPVAAESDPTLRAAASRAAGDVALARKDAGAAIGHFSKGVAAAGKDLFQVVMLQLGLARAHRLAGDNELAAVNLQKSLDSLEQLRSTFSSFEMRTALYGNLQNVFDEAVDFYDSRGHTERALAASEASRARAMLDLQVKAGEPSEASIRPRTLADIQASLTGAQTLVVYHQLAHKLVAWVITRDSLRRMATDVSADALHGEITRLRASIEQQDESVASIARSLHEKLIAPLRLAVAQDLIIVPHRALHLLPFQALRDESGWLIEKRAISTALSASLLRTAAALERPTVLAALGNPDLGIADWALPGAEREVEALRGLYEKGNVYLRKDATKDRLIQLAPGAEVLHVAAHAVVDEIDPMYSVIKLAIVAVGGRASSDMEAREFAALNLGRAQLVTLSACNSGLGKVAQGDEFMGFKRALLAAGAHSALVSLWPVDDDSTRALMTEFHLAWKTRSKAQAMQAAQVKVLSEGKFAHPFYWAPFVLVGSPA